MRAFFRARWDIFLYSAWVEVIALYVAVSWPTFKQRNSTKRHVAQDDDL